MDKFGLAMDIDVEQTAAMLAVLVTSLSLHANTTWFKGPLTPMFTALALVGVHKYFRDHSSQAKQRQIDLVEERERILEKIEAKRKRITPSSNGFRKRPTQTIHFADTSYSDAKPLAMDGEDSAMVMLCEELASAPKGVRKRDRKRVLYQGRRKGRGKDPSADRGGAEERKSGSEGRTSATATATPAVPAASASLSERLRAATAAQSRSVG